MKVLPALGGRPKFKGSLSRLREADRLRGKKPAGTGRDAGFFFGRLVVLALLLSACDGDALACAVLCETEPSAVRVTCGCDVDGGP